MTELTQTISNTKINVRWSEQYVSRGLNRQTGVFPPGLYDGGAVDYSTTTTLRIAAGTYVLRDVSDGFGLVLRDPDAATIDCSSLFPAASTKTWYVGVRASYTTGADTTCEYYFTDATPSTEHFVGKDALITAQVTIHSADTGLDQATFTALDGAKPTPYPLRDSDGSVLSTDRIYGLVDNVQAYGIPSPDEKDAFAGYPASPIPDTSNPFLTKTYLANDTSVRDYQSVTITSNIKFQLSGDIYFGTGTTSASVRPWLRLLNTVYDTIPYALSDGSLVTIDYMKTSADTTTLIPSTHADSDGFYANPWVYLTSSGGSIPNDTIACLCTQRVTLEDVPDELASIALASTNLSPHAEWIQVKEAGTDTAEPYDRWTISADTLQSALETLLGAVNQTQIDLRSFASSSDFKRIFRGGTIAADSGIGTGTPSVYVSRGCWVAVAGAYINGSGDIISSPTSTTDVSILGIKSDGMFFAFKNNASSSSNLGSVDSIDGTQSATWDCTYASDGPNGKHQFWGDMRVDGTVITDDEVGMTVGAGSTGAGEMSAPNYEHVWITNNATYNPTGDTFNRKTTDHGSVGVGLMPYNPTESYGPVLAACSSYGSSSWSESSWVPFGGFWFSQAQPVGAVFANGGDWTIPAYSYREVIEMDGFMAITCPGSSEMAFFILDNQTQITSMIYGSTAFWSETYGTSDRVSVAFSGSSLRVYNNTASSLTFNAGCFDVAQRQSIPSP